MAAAFASLPSQRRCALARVRWPFLRMAIGLSLAISLAATGVAQASLTPASPQVLILPFNNRSGDLNLDWIGESFVQALSDTLRGAGVPVVNAQERAIAFNQEGVPDLSTLSQATLIQVAAKAHAGWLILGRFDYVHGQFRARATIFNLRRQHLIRIHARRGRLAQLETIQARLAWHVLRVLAPKTTVTAAQVLAQRQQVPLAAYERYIRALLATEPAVRHKFLVAAVHLDPDYSQAVYRLGLWYWHNDDYRTALLWLPQVDTRDPNYPRALFLAARCAYRLGRYARAAELSQRLAALWPLPQVLNNWALAESRLGRKDALALLDRARHAAGADGAVRALLAANSAAVACELGNRAQAIRMAQAAAPRAGTPLASLRSQLQAPGAACPNATARALEQPARSLPLGKFRRMEATVERSNLAKAADMPPSQRLAFHLRQGRRLLRQGALDAARQEFLAALALAPRNAAAHVGLAELDLARHDAPAARAQVAVLRAIAPRDQSIAALERRIAALNSSALKPR